MMVARAGQKAKEKGKAHAGDAEDRICRETAPKPRKVEEKDILLNKRGMPGGLRRTQAPLHSSGGILTLETRKGTEKQAKGIINTRKATARARATEE